MRQSILEMSLVILGLMVLICQPALCAEAESESEAENGAQNQLMMLGGPTVFLTALIAKMLQ